MVLDSVAKMSNRPKRQGTVLLLGEIVNYWLNTEHRWDGGYRAEDGAET